MPQMQIFIKVSFAWISDLILLLNIAVIFPCANRYDEVMTESLNQQQQKKPENNFSVCSLFSYVQEVRLTVRLSIKNQSVLRVNNLSDK